MMDNYDLPDSKAERVLMMENILIEAASGGTRDGTPYGLLRNEFMADPDIRSKLPEFVRTHRSLKSFWPYIKNEAGSYAERRRIIQEAFTPLMDFLEMGGPQPGDQPIQEALSVLNTEAVMSLWSKLIVRRENDPEGAITAARTLLEAVIKHILDDEGVPFSEKDDLPNLYGKVAELLDLAPSKHTEEPIKAILGSAMNTVNGLGTLRNRLSDAHGRGRKLPVKPAPRHAMLAVNMAGAIAAFLVETHEARKAAR